MLSRRKRAAFIAVIVVGVFAFTELVSLVSIVYLHGSTSRLTEHRRSISGRDPTEPFRREDLPVMIHPFIGTVLQPSNDGGQLKIGGAYRITEFGFVDDALPIHRRSPDRVIVAILGGSVSRQMAMNASPILERELSRLTRFAGKSFRFVCLSVDGFKQPQQLMTITYLMSLGAEFDIVINLDGVNESALPMMDNVPFGVAAAYPRKWGTLISAAGSVQISRMVGLITYLRERQRDCAIAFRSFPWAYSPTCCLLWSVRHDRLERSIREQSDAISKTAEKEISFCASGPPEKFASNQQLFEHCAVVWSRSSILLHAICLQHGARYFHFLQPNQYVSDSKPFGSQETRLAINDASPFRIPIEQCYPIMRSNAETLRSAGVAFTDLTQIFADHSEQVYVDDCCHVNPTGDEIMATAIAARIRQHVDSEP